MASGFGFRACGEAVVILQRVADSRYPRGLSAVGKKLPGCARRTAGGGCPHMSLVDRSEDQSQRRRTGVSDPHGLSLSRAGYLSTNLANIFSGSMAMKVPRLRARTSLFSFKISAALMWV